jgi:hypothetical protein
MDAKASSVRKWGFKKVLAQRALHDLPQLELGIAYD